MTLAAVADIKIEVLTFIDYSRLFCVVSGYNLYAENNIFYVISQIIIYKKYIVAL